MLARSSWPDRQSGRPLDDFTRGALLDGPLQEDDRPRDEIALLEREPNGFPTLPAQFVETIGLEAVGTLLEPGGVLERNDEVLPRCHERTIAHIRMLPCGRAGRSCDVPHVSHAKTIGDSAERRSTVWCSMFECGRRESQQERSEYGPALPGNVSPSFSVCCLQVSPRWWRARPTRIEASFSSRRPRLRHRR